jgi:hypothetical protein
VPAFTSRHEREAGSFEIRDQLANLARQTLISIAAWVFWLRLTTTARVGRCPGALTSEFPLVPLCNNPLPECV